MGDSIPTGWKNQLADQMKASSMHCTAVGGAFVADFADTVHGSDPHSGQARDNVLSNQLLWLKKEIEEGIYTDTPDVIVIQIGTNTNGGASLTFDIEKEFTSDSEYIPLDHLDLVGNFTASYRWALEQLMADDMFPYARVFLCSPPQSALDKRDDADIRFRGDVVRRIARRMSVGFVDLYGCGIYSRWESSEGGRYYTDGAHPVYNQYSGGNKLIVDAIIAAMKNVGDNSPADLETEVNSATRCTFPAGSVLGSSGGRIVPVPAPLHFDYVPIPKLTGRLWHNGEPEYVVSIPIGKLANAGTVSVPHNIPDPAVRIKHNLSMSPFTADDSTVVVTFDAANMNVTTTADLSAVSAWIEIYYVKTGSATLTNLLKNADFSNGTANWNVNAAGTWEVVGDILKGTWTSDTAASRFRAYQQFSSTAFPPDHIYYIRASGRMAVWQNQDGTPATGYRQSGIRIGNAGGSTKLGAGRNGAVWDSMTQYSAVGNTNPDTTFNLFELDYLFPSFVGTGSTYELQNPMLIDLTEDFGAGNEPTKEWCDENIPFFMGELKI